ncbi:MAG: hypothetical protein IK104_01180 [Clostridia bacterium]|nr:hypothetical protein [Clostridia bacterium]
MAIKPKTRLAAIIAGDTDVRPKTRMEGILLGRDIRPKTNLEHFVKESVSGGASGNEPGNEPGGEPGSEPGGEPGEETPPELVAVLELTLGEAQKSAEGALDYTYSGTLTEQQYTAISAAIGSEKALYLNSAEIPLTKGTGGTLTRNVTPGEELTVDENEEDGYLFRATSAGNGSYTYLYTTTKDAFLTITIYQEK